MTPKERWYAVLRRQSVDRAPCDIWGTDEVFEMLCRHLGCADRWQAIDKLGIDAPFTLEPRYIGPAVPDGFDMWGVGYRTVDYGAGSYNEAAVFPLAEAKTLRDIDAHPWPRADWFDYSVIQSLIEPHAHRPIRTGHVEPFLYYAWMRGLQQAMMDLVEAPDLVERAFDHFFDFYTGYLERIVAEAPGRIDIALTGEDLGSQTGPLFSPAWFRRFHKPRFKKYFELAKQAGLTVFYHTDGASRVFLPELIELGIDILNPIQWRCPGMEREGLKADFGDRVIFHGGVDNQHTLPFGTARDVRDEVAKCYETLGAGGGYICAPCHNIQPNTPVENILAMYDAVKQVG